MIEVLYLILQGDIMLQTYLRDQLLVNQRKFFNRYPYYRQQEAGFTLMELLIVLALVAVISMIAVPIYRSYVQSAKITEGVTLASGIQLDVELFYTLYNRWPSSDNSHGELNLGEPESYAGNSVESIAVNGNQITVTYKASEVVGESGDGVVQLRLTADISDNGSVIRWRCVGENMPESDLPASCRLADS